MQLLISKTAVISGTITATNNIPNHPHCRIGNGDDLLGYQGIRRIIKLTKAWSRKAQYLSGCMVTPYQQDSKKTNSNESVSNLQLGLSDSSIISSYGPDD